MSDYHSFKVGDTLIGISVNGYNPYAFTHEGVEVVCVGQRYRYKNTIKVLYTSPFGSKNEYWVDPLYFELVPRIITVDNNKLTI